MRGTRLVIIAALSAAALAVVLVIALGGGESSTASPAAAQPAPGQPRIEFISPRNGARQRGLAVVVTVHIENFQLAPRHFGGEPLLGEGFIRFSLHRVPDCVYPAKLQRAIESPIGNERLQGASFDYPEHSGPNGVLGERIGSTGSFSPATRPEIFYGNMQPGFYRLIATLAANDGTPTPYHAVTTFQILEKPNHPPPGCSGGKVSSAKAATSFE